jgi:indoleamine 2,3-dioxygenase
LQAIATQKFSAAIAALEEIKKAWTNINTTMQRMPQGCDPYIYFHRVRPYIHGWKNNPALPQGLVYEGVEEYNQKPQQFRGETGAQSSILPTMDALFNISHERDPLWQYLMEMRNYMPPKHHAFIKKVEKHSTLRNFVIKHKQQVPTLRDLYNDCVSLIEKFRTQHLEFAHRYIHQQTAKFYNNTDIGTGGTPFLKYLQKHRNESKQHLL